MNYNNTRLINKFYRDYKKMVKILEEYTYLNDIEVIRFLNYKILKKFSEVNEMTEYKLFFLNSIKFLINEEIIIEKSIEKKIEDIVNNYSWTLNVNNCGSLTPDILGNVFEKFINQRENGAYYTPLDTIKYINKTSLYKYIINNSKLIDYKINIEDIESEFWTHVINLEELEIKRIISIITNIKIADISVGTGAFLINIIDILIEVIKKLKNLINEKINYTQLINDIFENNIYGIDLMEDAVNLAKFRFVLKYLQLSRKYDTDVKDILNLNLYTRNSLLIDKEKLKKLNINKFDLIVGNPPYIEYSKIRKNYKIENFKSIKAGNVYAYMIEKSLELIDQNGEIGLVVPISIISTARMGSLRDLLLKDCEEIYFLTFADRPASLFNGVHQKVTIVFANKNERMTSKVFTSKYIHWYEKDRKKLFNNIEFIFNNNIDEKFIPKIGNIMEKNIYNKLTKGNMSLSDLLFDSGDFSLYLSQRMTFWVKSFLQIKNGKEYKKMNFISQKDRDLYYLIINSDIFFYLWETISDGWHITNKELQVLSFNYEKYLSISEEKIKTLAQRLSEDIELNKEYIGSKQTEYIFKHKKSKIIIDEINIFINQLFSLNEKEIEYIRTYQISSRMNDELEKYNSKKGVNEK